MISISFFVPRTSGTAISVSVHLSNLWTVVSQGAGFGVLDTVGSCRVLWHCGLAGLLGCLERSGTWEWLAKARSRAVHF